MNPRHPALTFRWAAAFLAVVCCTPISHAETVHGRLLYAADDDWDWASPLGADELSKLSRYGEMSWSGLDWLEEGLEEVRGVLFGSPSYDDPKLENLSKVRGKKTRYLVRPPEPGSIGKILQQEAPPNLIILMQNKGADVVDLAKEDATSLMKFVEQGGRLLVLDDWRRYEALFDSAVGSALKNSPLVKELPEEEVEGEELDSVQVERLVAKLADEKFAVREAAKVELIKMGPRIFDLIDMKKIAELDQRAQLSQIRATLFPKKPSKVAPEDTNNYRDYIRSVERMAKASEKLTAARIDFHVEDVLTNKGSWPLPAIKLSYVPGKK